MNARIVLVAAFISIGCLQGDDYSFLPKKKSSSVCHERLEVDHDTVPEYEKDVMLEYEKYVCDDAKVKPVSQSMAFFTELGCYVFLKCLLFKEKIRYCGTVIRSYCAKIVGYGSSDSSSNKQPKAKNRAQ